MWKNSIIKLVLLIAVLGLIEADKKDRKRVKARQSKDPQRRTKELEPASVNKARYCVAKLDEDTQTYYEDLGCTITKEGSNAPDDDDNTDGSICFELTCPTGCLVGNGKFQYKIGEEWIERRKACSCKKGGWIHFNVPRPISDTEGEEVKPQPFKLPVRECLTMGCEFEDKFYGPGKTRPHPRGVCTCVKGNDPDLQDGRTLYYFKCPDRTRSSD